MRLQQLALGGLLVLLCTPIMVIAENQVHLKADTSHYDETNKQLTASGNVELKYANITIQTEKLIFDTYANTVWGTGNITVKRGEDEQFNSSYFYFNLDKNTVTLKDIHIAVTPPDSKDPLFVKADEITDKPGVKSGINGRITTCDLPNPHYYLHASRFDYYPDKRIIGYNVFVYTPIWIVPFGFWTPIYRYELGKRQWVLNFPNIGKKEGFGWFMQNTIDYSFDPTEANRDSSIYVDWFEKKGVGLGIRHRYNLLNDPNKGSIYYYHLQEQDTLQRNQRFELEQRLQVSDPLQIDVGYKNSDAAQLNTFSRIEKKEYSLGLKYDQLGDKYDISYKNNENIKDKINDFNVKIRHQFNHLTPYDIQLSQYENSASTYERTRANAAFEWEFPAEIKLRTQYDFLQENQSSQDLDRDQSLKSYYTITKPFNKNTKLTIQIDQIDDLDQSRVVSDDLSNKNDFFYKLPEIKVESKNPEFGPLQLDQTFTIARYQERQFDFQAQKARIFPDSDNFNTEPNTYILNQTLHQNFSGLPLKGTFHFSTGYNQYIFKTPDKSLFEGDALYTFDLTTGYTATLLPFLISDTSYNSLFSPEENNSPYFKFDRGAQKQNSIDQTLTLFAFDANKYAWSNKAGYDWVTERYTNYTTSLLIHPNSAFRFRATTGKNLNPANEFEYASRFQPLVGTIDLNPEKFTLLPMLPQSIPLLPISPKSLLYVEQMKFNYLISIDMNRWRDEKEFRINNSNITGTIPLGEDPQYRWELQGQFIYDTLNQTGKYEMERYELTTFKIVKKEHERVLEISYTKSTDEFRFKYTINAFPDEPLEVIRERENWRIGGRFDRSTEERL